MHIKTVAEWYDLRRNGYDFALVNIETTYVPESSRAHIYRCKNGREYTVMFLGVAVTLDGNQRLRAS